MAAEPTDGALRHRLGRLMAAVPTDAAAIESTSQPAPTSPPALVARTRLGLGGVTLALIAIVVGALALSQRPSSGGPVTGVATDGPFKLTITVPQGHYRAGEAITGVSGSLEYTGSGGAVRISHSAGGPIAFAIASGDGRHETHPIYDLACSGSSLVEGQPATATFAKSGGYFPEESDYPWLASYFANQSLALDAGSWTISAIAEFSKHVCGGTSHELRASATITVDPATSPTVVPSNLGPADWWVDPAFGSLGADTTVIHGLLLEHSCASRQSPEGRIVGPDIVYRQDAVVVTYRVRIIGGTCPSNPAYPVTITLMEPLAGRAIIDGGSGRDALIDPSVVVEPTVDCGPVVGTDDAKVACLAILQASLGDQSQFFTAFFVRPNDLACAPGECTDATSIEARAWRAEATDVRGSTHAWLCAYTAGTATCVAQPQPSATSRPGDPAPFESDPRFSLCGTAPDRTWMAFTMAHARDFTQHFPGWSAGAEELQVDDPALVVIGNGYPFRGGNPKVDPSATPQPPELVYEMCIAVGTSSDALIHHYGPTRFDAVVPVLGGPAVPMP